MAEANTSIYGTVGKNIPFGNMSLSDIVGTARNIQTYQGEQAGGELLRQHTSPEGDLDLTGYRKAIADDPRTQLLAPKLMSDALHLQQQQMALKAAQKEQLTATLGSLADKKDLSVRDINDALVQISGVTNIKPSVLRRQFGVDAVLSSSNPQTAMKDLAHRMSLFALGPEKLAAATAGPVNPQTGVSPQITEGEALERRRGLAAPPAGQAQTDRGTGMVTQNPEGFGIRAKGSAEAAEALHVRADTSKDTLPLLDTMEELSDKAGTGPSTDLEKNFNALYLRFFPNSNGLTFSKDEQKATEEFAKFGEQIAGQQASASHGTDAYLRNAYGANPNLHLSRLGRKGIIHVLQGNVDSDIALRKEWQRYRGGMVDGKQHADLEFRDWLAKFQEGYDFKTGKVDRANRWDPRVFQFMRMGPDERKEFLTMVKDPEAFEGRLHRAGQREWINVP